MWPNKVLIKHFYIHTHLSESPKMIPVIIYGAWTSTPQRQYRCRRTAREIWPLQSTWPSLHLLLSSVLDQSRGCGPGFGTWEGFDVSAVFIPVSGSLCSLSIMEEAISPASRPHHKNVSWYKETRWIITRQDSRCTPSAPSPPASLIASVSLIDCLVYFSPPLLPPLYSFHFAAISSLLALPSVSLSLSQHLHSR